MTTPSSISPVVKVDGVDLGLEQRDRLESLHIQLALRVPGRLVMRFNDSGYTLSGRSAFTVGSVVEVSSAGKKLFSGLITGVALEQGPYRLQLTVTADDRGVKLTAGNHFQTYINQTADEIVGKIASRNGLSPAADAHPLLNDYLLQADTDFDFLNQLADRTGYDWWVEDRNLHFKKPVAGATVKVRLTSEWLDEFTVRATALHPGSTTVPFWDPAAKQAESAQAQVSAARLQPTAEFVSSYVAGNDLSKDTDIRAAVDGATTVQEARMIAERLSQHWASGAVTARGDGRINPAVKLGVAMEVEQAGPASGTYHVTQVDHTYTPKGFRTRWTAGTRGPTSLVDSLGERPTGSFTHTGLVVGIVTHNKVDENGKVLGRPGNVKVKFVGTDDKVVSHWARVATIGAGPNRGITFMPEINDEVILGFEGGDVRRPVVLGSLYNGKDQAGELGIKNGQIERRRIMSRAGHFIEISDEQAEDKALIQFSLDGAAHVVTLAKDRFEAKIPSGKPFAVKAGNMGITLSADGTLTLEAKKIVLKATTDVEVSGVNVKAKATANFEASGMQAAMKGTGAGEVSSGGVMTVKGTAVQIN